MPTVKFFTLGCKANQYDTQCIREKFLQSKCREITNGKPADIYLINTCTVTHRADQESLALIRRVQRENPNSEVIVTGCLTEFNPQILRQITPRIKIIKNSAKDKISKSGISFFGGHTRAFLKIQDHFLYGYLRKKL